MNVSINEWADITLGDVISIKHGWPFKSEFFNEELTGKPIVVAIGNFEYSGGFRFESTSLKEYRSEYPREYELVPGDILLVMTCQTEGGEILGIPGRIPNDGRMYLHNQRMGKLIVNRPDLVSPDFLYYVFLSRDFNNELVASSSGTKIVHTSPSRIEAYRLGLPALSTQRAIASVLGALDDKIELNRRMNRDLEALAQGLFKSWFVDFDPVYAKQAGRRPVGVPEAAAKLFPSSFEDSALGPIPKGWRVGTIGEVTNNLDYKRIPLSGEERTKRQGQYPYYGAASAIDFIDEFIFDEILLLIGEDGSVVDDKGFSIRQYIWGKCWVNNHAHVLTGIDPFSVEYLYLFFGTEPIDGLVTGAVQPKLTQGNLNSIKLVVPAPKELRIANEVFATMFLGMRANATESRTLAALRDSLLEPLLSGELRVKDAEKLVASAL